MKPYLMKKAGFTLIELLIVVAIIAILAAIAIPNFLAAQTRSKVSRVKAELRSLATAMESYAVDNTCYPKAWVPQGGIGIGWQTPDLMPPYLMRIFPLTTPISYISSIPLDIFNPGKDRDTFDWSQDYQKTYVYFTSEYGDIIHLYSQGTFPPPSWVDENSSAKWRLASYGPIRQRLRNNTDYTSEKDIGRQDFEYDPTNGVVSNGFITRIGP